MGLFGGCCLSRGRPCCPTVLRAPQQPSISIIQQVVGGSLSDSVLPHLHLLGTVIKNNCLTALVHLHAARVRQDIYSLFHLDRPFKFISKTSNFLIPIIGWSMFLTGT